MGLFDIIDTHARRNPGGLAVVDSRRELTWADLRDNVLTRARSLCAALSPGNRLLVLSGNRAEVIETYLACAYAGIVAAPVNPALADAELHYAVTLVQPTAAITDATALARLDELALVTDGPRMDIAASPTPAPDPGAETRPVTLLTAPFVILQTSATTGRPKGVVIDQRSIQANVFSWLADVRPRPRTRFLQAGPLFHGSAVIALDYLAAECPVFILDRFQPQTCLRAIEHWKIEHTFLVPSMVRLLLDTWQLSHTATDTWRLLLHGAAPMPADLADTARAALGVDLQTIYGTTEAGGPALTLRPDDTPDLPAVAGATCIGLPNTGTLARIRDDHGNQLGPGEIGTLHLAGDGLMQGYWADPAATTASGLATGWLNTGDIAYTDDAGYYWILDRRTDLILHGGQNVYPAEIERVLRDHPDVADVAVVPALSPIWGQVPVAFIQKQSHASVGERVLAEHCTRHLAAYKRPSRFVFIDSIPQNPTGKILRRLLRMQADNSLDDHTAVPPCATTDDNATRSP